MAERTHEKPRYTDIPNKDDRPSQLLTFSFLYEKSTTSNASTDEKDEKNNIRLESNEITFFHSQKSVWFRQLLK